jgi:myosin-crossreactive antigen
MHAQAVSLLGVIKPPRVWLEGMKTITAFDLTHGGRTETIAVAPTDLVFFRNGSTTQNSSHGDDDMAAVRKRDTARRPFSPDQL